MKNGGSVGSKVTQGRLHERYRGNLILQALSLIGALQAL